MQTSHFYKVTLWECTRHRVSIDLDFFSEADELEQASRQEIVAAFGQRFPLEVDEGGLASLLINVRGSYVGFFGYNYPLLAPTYTVAGVKLAGILDIGLMKMDALAGRGSRKDFYDLYFIARQIPLEDLLARGKDKWFFGNSGVMARCRGEPVCSPREGRHAGLPLPHEIQKTQINTYMSGILA